MKRGTSTPSRHGLFYSNHFDLAHCSDLQAAFVWRTTDCHRCFLKVGHWPYSAFFIRLLGAPDPDLRDANIESNLENITAMLSAYVMP